METLQDDLAAKNQLTTVEDGGRAESAGARKVYEKPLILYRSPLEAMAATCSTFPGKANGICDTAFS